MSILRWVYDSRVGGDSLNDTRANIILELKSASIVSSLPVTVYTDTVCMYVRITHYTFLPDMYPSYSFLPEKRKVSACSDIGAQNARETHEYIVRISVFLYIEGFF